MERGYIKLWRKTLDSGLLQHPTAWQVFGYLLMSATRVKRKLMVAGQVFELEAGDYATSVAGICDFLGITTRQCRTALSVLEKLEIVTIKTTNRGSIISLVNWHRYQDERQADVKQSDKQTTSERQTNDKPIEQEVKNINTPLDTSLRSVSIPQGGATEKQSRPRFIPPTVGEVRDYCESRGNSIDPQAFVDFYESNGWKVGKNQMKDWRAAVRTWEAKRKESPRPEPRRMNKAEELAAHNRAVCQEVYEMFTGMQAEQGVFDL